MSAPARFLVFVRERFPPGAYLPLICVFVAAGYLPSVVLSGAQVQPLGYILAALVVGAAFLHLRIVDELKDAEVDRQGRPWRPLPRGLVSERELARAAVVVLLLAVGLAAMLGLRPLVAFLPAVAWIVLADAEFFAREWIHRDLVVYALAHSAIVPLLMVFAWCASPAAVPSVALAGLALLAWGVGLGLEVGRKTYAPDEERPFVETYSSALGRRHALQLAFGAMAVGMLGGAAYAGLAGAGAAAVVVAMLAAALIAIAGSVIRDVRRRTSEVASSIVGLAILLWPSAIAVALGGPRP